MKDATANLARVSLQRHAMGPDFVQLSGEDMTALAYMGAGGHGCISVTSNVAPRLCADLQSAALEGDYRRALGLQDKLVPLHGALFVEPSPAGPKYGLSLLGRMSDEVRLPMVSATPPARMLIRQAMAYAGLIDA